MQYRRQRIISGAGVERDEFADALRGIALDARDRLHVVGDSCLKIFDEQGKLLAEWELPLPGYSVAVAADGRIFVGQAGQIQLFTPQGKPLATWKDKEHLGLVTQIALADDLVLAGDVNGRCIRVLDKDGHYVRDIGNDNRMKGFLIPNGHVDFAVDEKQIIHAVDPGKHRVERYDVSGKALGYWGGFGGLDPAKGFNGCCNPTNIALLPEERIVVTTKAGPQIKIYTREGEFQSVFGEDDFDPGCKNMDVAVDSKGRIYVVDTVRLHIAVYAPSGAPAHPQGPNPQPPNR